MDEHTGLIPWLIFFSFLIPFLIWYFINNNQWSGDLGGEEEVDEYTGQPTHPHIDIHNIDKDDY